MLKFSRMRCSELLFTSDKVVEMSLEKYAFVSSVKRVAIVAIANPDRILPRRDVWVMSGAACWYIMVDLITESSVVEYKYRADYTCLTHRVMCSELMRPPSRKARPRAYYSVWFSLSMSPGTTQQRICLRLSTNGHCSLSDVLLSSLWGASVLWSHRQNCWRVLDLVLEDLTMHGLLSMMSAIP